ncbi:MAG: hypothetical protein ABWZ25_17145 [Chitinophagaceae bacterium]
MFTTTDLTPETLASAASKLPGDKPVVMVNLLQYFDHTSYRGENGNPLSGREVYLQHYVPAFYAVAEAVGVKVQIIHLGAVAANLVAPEKANWTDVGIIGYADYVSFRKVIEDKRYLEEAEPHRTAALQNWRLFATIPLQL